MLHIVLLAAAMAATAPPGDYRSAFTGYRAFQPEETLRDWRQVNDEVKEAGGHLGILRGMRSPSTGAPAEAHSGHAGHGSTRETPPPAKPPQEPRK